MKNPRNNNNLFNDKFKKFKIIFIRVSLDLNTKLNYDNYKNIVVFNINIFQFIYKIKDGSFNIDFLISEIYKFSKHEDISPLIKSILYKHIKTFIPLFIFEGLSLDNLNKIFKLNNIKALSGYRQYSNKLNSIQYYLSMYLHLIEKGELDTIRYHLNNNMLDFKSESQPYNSKIIYEELNYIYWDLRKKTEDSSNKSIVEHFEAREFEEFKRFNRAQRYKIQREKIYKYKLNEFTELNKVYFNQISLTFKKINLILKLLNSLIELLNKVKLSNNSEEGEVLLVKIETSKSKSRKELIYNYIKYIEYLNIDELKSKDINKLKEEFFKIKEECIKERINIESVNIRDFFKKYDEFFNYMDNNKDSGFYLVINLDHFYYNLNRILTS
jgi:hypothetical protein